MEMEFERGDPGEPKGHALVYFRAADDENKIYATYLITPPINIELSKYMPPMFASKMAFANMESISSIPLPPVPEPVKSQAYLKKLAEWRDDDLIYAGTLDASDIERALFMASEAAQSYFKLYKERPQPILEEEEAATDVSEVLYIFMSEKDRLGELAKLVGKLRYAIEGQDQHFIEETTIEMEGLGKHLPEKYKIKELLQVAKTPGEMAGRLSKLYTERCYKICEEDYIAVERIEKEIKELQASL